MGAQLSSRAVINQIVRQGLFQGQTLDSPASNRAIGATSTITAQKGDLMRNADGFFITMCDIDTCEGTSVAGT